MWQQNHYAQLSPLVSSHYSTQPRAASNARKRDAYLLNLDAIIVVSSNCSRWPIDQELKREFGLVRCQADCTRELGQIEQEEPGLIVVRPPGPTPATVLWTTTSTPAFVTGGGKSLSSYKGAEFLQQTQM